MVTGVNGAYSPSAGDETDADDDGGLAQDEHAHIRGGHAESHPDPDDLADIFSADQPSRFQL